jgi:hypothetical protein
VCPHLCKQPRSAPSMARIQQKKASMSGRDGRIHSKNGIESDRELAYNDGHGIPDVRGHGHMENVD